MTHFNAKPHEVREMLGCDEFCAIRPLKPQPEPWKDFYEEGGCQVSDWRFSLVHDATEDGKTFFTALQMACQFHEWRIQRLPFSPGDVVTVKETFARVVTYKGPSESVVFRADSRDSSGAHWHEVAADPTSVKWSRPQNMRPEWSRLTLTVESVSVKRVQSVTIDEAELACIPIMDPEPEWNQHHPKTPWDANPWVCVARAKVHHCNVKEMKGEAA